MRVWAQIVKQLFSKPFTNLFPGKYKPDSVTDFLDKVGKGEVSINPSVPIPPDFRGKIKYDVDKCIGCKMCISVCPADAIEFVPGKKKVKFYMTRCTFCAICTEICPVKCIHMTDEFLMATEDRHSEVLIVK